MKPVYAPDSRLRYVLLKLYAWKEVELLRRLYLHLPVSRTPAAGWDECRRRRKLPGARSLRRHLSAWCKPHGATRGKRKLIASGVG